MEFVRVIKGYDHLWAVKEPDKELDELTSLFERRNDADYLFQFFKENIDDLKSYFKNPEYTVGTVSSGARICIIVGTEDEI